MTAQVWSGFMYRGKKRPQKSSVRISKNASVFVFSGKSSVRAPNEEKSAENDTPRRVSGASPL
jgi:hypothetical protein